MTCSICQGAGVVRQGGGTNSRGQVTGGTMVACRCAAAAPSPIATSGPTTWHPATTLGAIRPGEGYCSAGAPPYWMPCWSRGVDAAGAAIADTHAWFVTSARAITVLCPTCHAARGTSAYMTPEQVAPTPAPAPMDTARAASAIAFMVRALGRWCASLPIRAPWGDVQPIWGRLAHRARSAELRERFGERAAILEYDAGRSRPYAEHLAYAELLELLNPSPRQMALL